MAEIQQSNFPAGISAPARRARSGAGYTSLEQLASISKQELLKLHGMEPKAVTTLREALQANDLSFAGK